MTDSQLYRHEPQLIYADGTLAEGAGAFPDADDREQEPLTEEQT